jgi:predicted O-methyltransferase YrrM
VRKIKPIVVVETGVAAGWSSLAILRALGKNGKGKLYSSDFPYFRLENPGQYVGYLAKNEINKIDWFLDIRGDNLAIPEILKRIGSNNIDLIHYDSDKSYSGWDKVLKNLFPKISHKTIIIFDDIQDNLYFKNLIERTKKDYFILQFKGKYLGIIGANFLLKK